jgi:hypothetical protein
MLVPTVTYGGEWGQDRRDIMHPFVTRMGSSYFSGKIYAKLEATFYRILMLFTPCYRCLSSHAFSADCVASSENPCRRISISYRSS